MPKEKRVISTEKGRESDEFERKRTRRKKRKGKKEEKREEKEKKANVRGNTRSTDSVLVFFHFTSCF